MSESQNQNGENAPQEAEAQEKSRGFGKYGTNSKRLTTQQWMAFCRCYNLADSIASVMKALNITRQQVAIRAKVARRMGVKLKSMPDERTPTMKIDWTKVAQCADQAFGTLEDDQG